jgi:hypothetical protein
VNVRERIARLEAILARVTERAAAPRQANGAAAPAVPVPQDLSATAEMPVDEPTLSREPVTPLDVEVSELTEEAPMVAEVAQPEAAPRVDEIESRERMIAAPEREPEVAPISAPISAEVSERPAAALAPDPDVSDGPEITVSEVSEAPEITEVLEEEPPASSRRAIAVEPKLEELAFGEAAPMEPGPHTPPPESGRQVAAPPVDLDFEGEFTGVRPRDAEASAIPIVSEAPKTEAEAAAAPLALAPEPIVAKLPSAAPVAFRGAAPSFSPATFGELLDATLSL